VEASDVKPWRKVIAKAAETALVDSGLTIFDEPVMVSAVFVFPKPKSVKRVWPSVMPDLDKLARAVGDALSVDSKLILVDDSRIVHWNIWKRYGDQPGVHVTLMPVDVDPEIILLGV
jgi:Holliday junction resolvase RusA-like endonuclease